MRSLTGYRFHALGTEIKIVAVAPDVEGLRSLVAQYEARLSRFLPNSELQQLCRAAGQEFIASEALFDVLSLAQRFWQETNGIFDPLVRPQLEAAGYDRTFDAVPEASWQPERTAALKGPAFDTVVLDPQRRTVLLPEGATLDLGGIAKAWIIERLAEHLTPHGPFLIDIGGDMIARGDGPDGGPGWLISVADPYLPERDICWLRLRGQAIATSTTMRRRWQLNGRWMHHIIDPRTGAPSRSDLAQVTVVAPSATEADIYAKTALILGAEAGLPWLRRRELPALLVGTNGTLATPQWPRLETLMTA